MHPEQPRTGLALQRRQADSAPRGVLSTGLLQGLIQSVRPPSFCFVLPRVHAADVAAAQPAQMPSSSSSSSSTSPAPEPILSPSTMPSNLGRPEFPDTGWDRIKDLFEKELVFLYLFDFPPFSLYFLCWIEYCLETSSLFSFSAPVLFDVGLLFMRQMWTMSNPEL